VAVEEKNVAGSGSCGVRVLERRCPGDVHNQQGSHSRRVGTRDTEP
jgi:hypothetical protein